MKTKTIHLIQRKIGRLPKWEHYFSKRLNNIRDEIRGSFIKLIQNCQYQEDFNEMVPTVESFYKDIFQIEKLINKNKK